MTEKDGLIMEIKKDPEVLEKLYVIDFDRTLVDSSRLGNILLDAVDSLGYDSLPLRQKLDEGRGKSLQLLAEVEKVVGSGRLTELKTAFLHGTSEARLKKYSDGGFFEPGARYLLGVLPEGQRMVFTYGDDADWQTWKLEAAGLTDQHYAITTEKGLDGRPLPKPRLLEHMKQNDGTFAVQSVRGDTPLIAKSLIMIDDKPENLTNLPDGVTGYLYYPGRVRKEYPVQKQEEYARFLEENPGVIRLTKLRKLLGRTSLV